RARSASDRRRKRSRLAERKVEGAARAADPQAAVIVNLDFGDDGFEERVAEIVRLVESAGVRRHRLIKGKRPRPDPKFFAGSGKVEEIGRAVAELNAAFIVFNHELSPAQQRNVERALEHLGPPRVFDRTELI